MTSCRQIVALLSSFQFMANLEQSGSQILEPQSVKLTFTITVTFYLAKTESRTKKSPTQLSHYCFDFLQKNADISRIKRTLVLKRISIILTRLRQGVILFLSLINMVYTSASRVAEPLKTYDLRKLANIRKVSKPHRMIAFQPE